MEEFVLDENKNCFKLVKEVEKTKCVSIWDDFLKLKDNSKINIKLQEKDLILKNELYAKTENETVRLQTESNAVLLKTYKRFLKLVGYCKKHKIEINKKIFVENFEKYNGYNANIFECIINAKLNYKHKNRLIYVYDRMCEVIDGAYNAINPCGFKKGKCGNPKQVNPHNPNACCNSKCKFLTDKGCITKNLSCKLFFCKHARKSGYVLCTERLLPLVLFWNPSMRGIVRYNYFMSREKLLNKLNYARFLHFLVV